MVTRVDLEYSDSCSVPLKQMLCISAAFARKVLKDPDVSSTRSVWTARDLRGLTQFSLVHLSTSVLNF